LTRSSLPARLAPALILAALLAAGGCARLTGEGRLVEAEAGPGAGQTARLLRMADDAAGAGDPATAANLYARVLALEPNDRVAARRLGEALLRTARWQEAIDAFRRVLAAEPGEPEASRGLARALLAIGRPEAALAALDQALARAPDDPRLVNAKGVALDQLGRHEEAQAVYRAGLARWPENPSLRNNLGLSLALAGRYGEAIGELEPLARGPQETPRARHNLAAAYALKGDLRAAEALLKLDLDDRDVRSTLAYYAALRGLGSPRAARGMLRSDTGPGEMSAAPAARVAARNEPGPSGEPPASSLEQPVGGPVARPRSRAPEGEPATAGAIAGGDPTGARSRFAAVDPGSSPPAVGTAGARVPAPTPARAEPVTIAAKLVPEERSVGDATAAAAGSGSAADGEGPASRSAAVSAEDARGDEAGGTLASLPAAPPSAARALPALPIEPARGGDWVVELGVVADGEEGRARWRELRRAHGEALAGAARLGGDAGGPLLAGPFADRAEAERACARLAASTECRVSRL
jgi:Flp pilus assembly protein TadD/cell division septation protein DedD